MIRVDAFQELWERGDDGLYAALKEYAKTSDPTVLAERIDDLVDCEVMALLQRASSHENRDSDDYQEEHA